MEAPPFKLRCMEVQPKVITSATATYPPKRPRLTALPAGPSLSDPRARTQTPAARDDHGDRGPKRPRRPSRPADRAAAARSRTARPPDPQARRPPSGRGKPPSAPSSRRIDQAPEPQGPSAPAIRLSLRLRPRGRIVSAFFGQFMDHDLTRTVVDIGRDMTGTAVAVVAVCRATIKVRRQRQSG